VSEIHLVRDYSQPPALVWRALTDQKLMASWMVAAVPEGFSPAVGTRFRFVGKPTIGWSGIVKCEVLEAVEPTLLRYSWVADDEAELMEVTYRLEPHGTGTRFTFLHTGFTGAGGLFLAKAVMTPIRKKMFGERLLAVLGDLDEEGPLPPGSALRPSV
jgi:uncharacterized protein YndB with AHSA1/START domain